MDQGIIDDHRFAALDRHLAINVCGTAELRFRRIRIFVRDGFEHHKDCRQVHSLQLYLNNILVIAHPQNAQRSLKLFNLTTEVQAAIFTFDIEFRLMNKLHGK